MHAGKKYTLVQVVKWTKKNFLMFCLVSSIPVILYEVFDLTWLKLPWLPIASVGTAVAFYIGFKNNGAYDRLWEARKIYGGIVNSSRSLTAMLNDFIGNQFADDKKSEQELENIKRRIVKRHIAWLTALRYQLRQLKKWEHDDPKTVEYRKGIVEETDGKMMEKIAKDISKEDLEYISTKGNKATQLLNIQSKEFGQLRKDNLIDCFRHIELQNMVTEFYTLQGKAERIKNFPFPRHYATITEIFVWLFILLLPFGMMTEFASIGEGFIWASIPFSGLVSWVFHTMNKIGESSENPFEGMFNDVPITALSRTIEIDLLEMIDEPKESIPEPLGPVTEFETLM